MNEKLPPDALIEAALLTQTEPLNEKSMRERLGSLQEQRAPRYSRAVMETLAIIAYQQPVTRGDIEGIRGVAVSQNVMQTLQDRGWIEVIGHRDSVGRPALWATTATFLSDLRLDSLEELPPLTELGELVLPDLVETPPTDTDEEENDMLRPSENGELLLN